MNPSLLRVLQGDNPWLLRSDAFPAEALHHLPDPYVPRVVPGMERWPVAGKGHLVVGARQVGKSSLLWHWIVEHGRAPLYVNCEALVVREWCRDGHLLRADIEKLVPSPTPVLLEEVQHLDEAGLLVKGIVDAGLRYPLLVTGSSAFHLRSRTRESLAGRALRVELHPFSLREIDAALPEVSLPLQKLRRRDLAKRQMSVGSYPEVWQAEDPERVLFEILEAFVVRDASDLFRIQHVGAFRTLLSLIAGQVGDLVNVSEWASICGIARDTVDSYVDVLVESNVLVRVPPFVGGRRAELLGRPKLFFRDLGIRNAVLGRFPAFAHAPDRGKLLGSWLVAELRKHLSGLLPADRLRFWRSKGGAEVDLVLQRPFGLVAFEAKAARLPPGRLSRSARSFISAYEPARFVVLHLGEERTERAGATELCWVGPEALAEPQVLLAEP